MIMALSDKKYDWDRYWVPRGGFISFGDHGFLSEPEDEEFGVIARSSALTFESISKTPCLALLGEPGIGKSETLKSLASQRSETTTLRIDLAGFASDAMLHKAIFESPAFTAWVNSAATLEIFLDSLDECLIHVRTVARLLVDQFAKYPRSRLRLRIACRTAEWPQLLSKELPALWGDQDFAEYELRFQAAVDKLRMKLDGSWILVDKASNYESKNSISIRNFLLRSNYNKRTN